jgi:hypothetical protein
LTVALAKKIVEFRALFGVCYLPLADFKRVRMQDYIHIVAQTKPLCDAQREEGIIRLGIV